MKTAKRSSRISLPSLSVLVLLGCGGESGDAERGQLENAGREPTLTGAAMVGAIERLDNDDAVSCYRRSIWDMHTFEGRIFIGYGDWDNNTGPVKVYSLGDDGVNADFRPETIVDEEAVIQFRDYGGTLYIPGIDAREDWSFGNFYQKRNDVWTKHRTIPNALHVWDIAEVKGNLYAMIATATGGATLESTDRGATWHKVLSQGTIGMLVPMDDFLAILSGEDLGDCPEGCSHVYKYRDGRLEVIKVPVPIWSVGRSVRFGKGALTASPDLHSIDRKVPLVYFGMHEKSPHRDLTESAPLVGNVRDILVEDGVAYVLTVARAPRGGFMGYVFATEDLYSWKQVARFRTPAPAYSFARMGGRFYVGLGPDGWYEFDKTPERYSGTIWRLE